MSNIINHAKKELEFAGYKPSDNEDGPNKWIRDNVLELLEVFCKQGHSGSSASYAISMFSKLAAFEPLTPLSGEDDEWQECGDGVLQNVRCSNIFKDGGAVYDINGYIFWSWSEGELCPDEDGYPGIRRYKSNFSSRESRRAVAFPCDAPKPEYVEVSQREVNKDTGEDEPGSGLWETTYPEKVIKEMELLDKAK